VYKEIVCLIKTGYQKPQKNNVESIDFCAELDYYRLVITIAYPKNQTGKYRIKFYSWLWSFVYNFHGLHLHEWGLGLVTIT